ncbi:MAG: MDR family MFS transporter [Janthinobacterium lividum]
MSSSSANPLAPDASLRDWIAVASTMLGAFMAILDIQITNASLTNIEGAIGASSSEGSWISTSYLIAEIIVIPLTTWLSGVVGLRRYLMINAGLFILFSLACAQASDLTEMILFRAGQGLTGGVLIPVAVTVLRTRLPRHQQMTGIAMFGFTSTFAPSIGPSLGGWLTDQFSWHYLFYLNIVPGIVTMVMLFIALDPKPPCWSDFARGDWIGIPLMAAGLASLTVVLEEGQRLEWFSSPTIRMLSLVAVIGTGGFIARQILSPRPFLDVRLLANPTIGSACVISAILGGVSIGSVFIIPLFCGQIHNYNPEQIGWVVMWAGLPQLVMYPMIPFLIRKIDMRLLILTGILVFSASCFLNTRLSMNVGMSQLILPQILRGIGQPLFSGPLSQLATTGLSREQVPHVSALFTMLRNLGGSICIATISTIVARREQYHFSVISEHVTRNAVATQKRVDMLTEAQANLGPVLAHHRALAAIAEQVRQQATVMSFSDAFMIIGISMAVCVVGLTLLRQAPRPTVSP